MASTAEHITATAVGVREERGWGREWGRGWGGGTESALAYVSLFGLTVVGVES